MTDVQYTIYQNIQKFITEYRKYTITGDVYTSQTFNKNMLMNHYVELDCLNENQTKIRIILFKNDSKYLKATQLFKKLIITIGKTTTAIILITKDPLSVYIKKLLITMNDYDIKSYLYRHFIIEIPKGPLCGKHVILSQDEVRHLCDNELMTHPAGLPSILVDDPQCIWIGAEVGQVVKCIFNSELTGITIQYRMVVPSIGKAQNESE